MILVDTSVWIDHLRRANPVLVGLLDQNQVVTHPLVIAELALGSIANRSQFLGLLRDLPWLADVSHDEFAEFVEGRAVWGKGIGVVDGHLLASVLLVPGALLWTQDRRLATLASELHVAAAWSP